MSSAPSRLTLLLQKYLNNNCSADELQEFWVLMFEFPDDNLISKELSKLWNDNPGDFNPSLHIDWNKAYEKLKQKNNENKNTDDTKMIRGAVEQPSSLNIVYLLYNIIFNTGFFIKKYLSPAINKVNNINHLYIKNGYANCELK